jgi:hypothetical protein
MATKKSAKDEALEDIAAMDKGSPEKKEKASSKKVDSKPRSKDDAKEAAPADDPKEKEEFPEVKPLMGEAAVGTHLGKLSEAEVHAEEKEAARKDIEKAINDTMPPTGFDLDDEDAPEPPETTKMEIITTKHIPAAQRFNRVSPVKKATKTVMITTKNMKEFLNK